MGDNVVMLDVVTKLDVPPERILQEALKANPQSVVIIGYDSDGEEYFASSVADGGTVLWMLERAKNKLLAVPETHFGDND